MKNKLSTNLRKWISLIIAIIIYYVVHEGGHLIISLLYNAFVKVKFLGIGMQVVVNVEILNDLQLAVFCVTGAFLTLIFAYVLVFFRNRIVSLKNNYVKAIGYYTSLILLLLDPIYLSFLYKFFGGGDMNGIKLFGLPEFFIQIIFIIIGIINLIVFVKLIYPKYKESFKKEC